MRSQIKKIKKFRIHTLGCKVNQYESQAMRELLVRSGLKESGPKDAADVYIVNTCTVTGAADRESKSIIGRFHKINPNARIVVTGCLAEKDSRDLSSLPGVSEVLKNSNKNRIAIVAAGHKREKYRKIRTELTISGFKDHSKAYVKIQDGCDNGCSYCKVPLVRGRPKSKPIGDIAKEVDGLVRNGFKEIVLTGICLGAWGKDLRSERIRGARRTGRPDLLDVLKVLDKIEGDFRIRLSSIEPKYVTEGLIKFMAEGKRMCAHLHIPFQSGDDEVLKLMNRPYTAREYRAIVKRVRAIIPRIAITTDILIGFPGETDARFKRTMAFIRSVAPSRTHIFTFSRREGTPAFDMKYIIDIATLKKRYNSISALTLDMANAYKKCLLGQDLSILVESKRDKSTGFLKGYSDNYMQVFFEGPDALMRNIVPVKVVGVDDEKVLGSYG